MTRSPVRFESLIERHHDEIYRYVWRLLHTAGPSDPSLEAQDLTQEVFLRAFKNFPRLRRDSNHRAWLYKIATHCTYTAFRQSRRRAVRTAPLDRLERLPSDPNQSPEHQFGLSQSLASLGRAITHLPPKQKAAVVLRHLQGLEYAEIAQTLDCSADSARANVYQGLQKLRAKLSNEQGRVKDE